MNHASDFGYSIQGQLPADREFAQPTPFDQLPAGALIWAVEKRPEDLVRVLVFSTDKETGATCIKQIVEAGTIVDAVEHIAAEGIPTFDAWVSIEHEDGSVRYLQPDCITLAEALEASAGTPWRQEAPPPPTPLQKIEGAIRDYHFALDTRQHGGVATHKALEVIQEALQMPWIQNAEKQRRSK